MLVSNEMIQQGRGIIDAVAENPEYYAKLFQSEIKKRSVQELQQMLDMIKQGMLNELADSEVQNKLYSIVAGQLAKKRPQQRQQRMGTMPSYNNSRKPTRR